MKGAPIAGAVAIVIAIVAGVTVLDLFGKDVTPLLLVMTSTAIPAITALLIRTDVRRVEGKVDSVDQKVNGHLSDLTSKIADPNSTVQNEQTGGL